MRLSDLVQEIKDYGTNKGDLPKDVFVAVLIGLVGLGAFLLGRLSTAESERKAELRLLQAPGSISGGVEVGGRVESLPKEAFAAPLANEAIGGGEAETVATVPAVKGTYVASKKGEVYYLPWCGGVKLIKEENKIWFATKAEAEQKGYRPAANCKGI